jgi:tetratricopeptide (TPR) repeat protein
LFTERAAAAGAQVPLTAENAPLVGEICRRLDGLPLAIELAAAWTPMLPLPALLRRLDRALRFLDRGAPDADQRQQTLYAAIDWSYRLLDDRERILFRRLGVFVDGCRLEAAEAVCPDPEPGGRLDADDVLPGLASLVEKNLLQPRTDPDGEPRFRMLQTIREFADDLLTADPADAAAVRFRHADHYLAVPSTLASGREELQRLLADRANLQEAFETVHEQGRDDRIAAAIPQVWRVWRASRLGMRDGVRWAELVLTGRHELPGDVELPMLFAVSELFRFTGDPAQARALKEDAIALARDAPELVRAPQMRTRFAYALASLADLAMDDGRYDEARELLHESLAEGGAHRAFGSLGYLALLEDDLPTAERYVLAALDGFAGTDELNYNENLALLGTVRRRRGNPDGARAALETALRGFADLGDTNAVARVIDALGAVAADRG